MYRCWFLLEFILFVNSVIDMCRSLLLSESCERRGQNAQMFTALVKPYRNISNGDRWWSSLSEGVNPGLTNYLMPDSSENIHCKMGSFGQAQFKDVIGCSKSFIKLVVKSLRSVNNNIKMSKKWKKASCQPNLSCKSQMSCIHYWHNASIYAWFLIYAGMRPTLYTAILTRNVYDN